MLTTPYDDRLNTITFDEDRCGVAMVTLNGGFIIPVYLPIYVARFLIK